jgi:hypothetical protein
MPTRSRLWASASHPKYHRCPSSDASGWGRQYVLRLTSLRRLAATILKGLQSSVSLAWSAELTCAVTGNHFFCELAWY